jgi:pimeloyl-ACP methyl ester carboxylesterase
MLPADDRDPLTALAQIDVPLVFVHGKRDRVIPHAHSEALHAAARGSRLWLVPDADHMAPFIFPGPWREKLVAAMDHAVR